MKKSFILFSVLFISCEKLPESITSSFNEDELKWFYFTEKMSDNQSYIIDYKIKDKYLDFASITSKIETYVYEYVRPLKKSTIIYQKGKCYFYLSDYHYDYNIRANIETIIDKDKFRITCFNVECVHYYYDTIAKINITDNKTFFDKSFVDTATVNNKFYEEVYKFENIENFKSLYFAKGYGFVKLELNNGYKIELF